MMSSKVSMPDLPTSSRWPGDSIWKTPRVRGLADHVEGRRVVERHLRLVVEVDLDARRCGATRSTAWAIEDCIRMPSTSSLSSPRSSTSSLSNWLIGNPTKLASTGVRSSSVRVGQQHPARVDGDVAGQPVEPLDEVEHQVEPLRRSSPAARSSGRSRSAIRASRARMCGNALAIASISPGGMPSARADVADRVTHAVGVHHRDADAPLAAVAVEDRARRSSRRARTRRRRRCRAASRAAARGTAPSAGRGGSGRPRRCRAGS